MSDADAEERTEARIWGFGYQRDRINELKRGGETQADVLDRVLFGDDEDSDDSTDAPAVDTDELAAAVAAEIGSADVDADELADALAARLSLPSLEDIKNAAERGAQQGVENLGH